MSFNNFLTVPQESEIKVDLDLTYTNDWYERDSEKHFIENNSEIIENEIFDISTYDSNKSNVTLNKMLKLFNNQTYSDLVFKIEEKYIYAQKCVLGTNCKYFESKFAESTRAMRESTENKTKDNAIEITEYSYDVYYSFLKYLYTDCVDIESEKAMDLLVLANDYKEEELKPKCVDIIKKGITIKNVCSLYCSSIKYNLTEFENHCFNFAVKRMNQICLTEGFRKMNENSMKKLMERVAKSKAFKY
jgi:hypothetical protein